MASTPPRPSSSSSSSSYEPRSPPLSRQPLVHFVTNSWRHDSRYRDDIPVVPYSDDQRSHRRVSESIDYSLLDNVSTSRVNSRQIPRKLQRWMFIYAICLLALGAGWKWVVKPQWDEHNLIQKSLDGGPRDLFGNNVRPDFKDLIMVKDLDAKFLPETEGGKTQRLVFVGDVHGCVDELKHLLHKVKFNQERDHLVLTGDIIAKGPDSPGVIDFAHSVGASCVRGNHEDRVLLAWREMHPHSTSTDIIGDNVNAELSSNAISQSSSRGIFKPHKLAEQLSRKQINWLQSCPVILRVGSISTLGTVVVVHAGLVPGVALDRQDPFQTMNMRSIDLKTHLPSKSRDGMPWEKLWNGYQKKMTKSERITVVYGHDSRRGLNIKKYSKGLDSRCVGGGDLTGMVVELGKDGKVKEWFESVGCKGYGVKSVEQTPSSSV